MKRSSYIYNRFIVSTKKVYYEKGRNHKSCDFHTFSGYGGVSLYA